MRGIVKVLINPIRTKFSVGWGSFAVDNGSVITL